VYFQSTIYTRQVRAVRVTRRYKKWQEVTIAQVNKVGPEVRVCFTIICSYLADPHVAHQEMPKLWRALTHFDDLTSQMIVSLKLGTCLR